MPLEAYAAEASKNLEYLTRNPYPGRGIIVGFDESGKYLVQVYWIMGRRENSRNRVFLQEEPSGRLYTAPADQSKVKDPSLIIYNAMRENVPYYFVSNGDQTDTVAERYGGATSLEKTLAERTFEPDEPNFTQRITAVGRLGAGRPHVEFSILRKSRFNQRCDRSTYLLSLDPGFGFCITTYSGDGDPLPAFRGDPYLLPLAGDAKKIAELYWTVLNVDNRVSLAVKWIECGNGRSDIHIINKYRQAA